jgi:hypothetical protein
MQASTAGADRHLLVVRCGRLRLRPANARNHHGEAGVQVATPACRLQSHARAAAESLRIAANFLRRYLPYSSRKEQDAHLSLINLARRGPE